MIVQATVGGRTVALDIHTQGGKPRVAIAGNRADVELLPVSLHSWSLLIDGRSYHLSVTPHQQGYQVHLDDNLFHVNLQSELDRTIKQMGMGSNNSRQQGDVLAAIPGIITVIEIKEGQQVAAGDPLLILEAMKMENELVAPIGGIVKQIAVAIGKTVEKGTLLVRLEPS